MENLANFLRYLDLERNYSVLTQLAYEEDINDFFDFLKETGSNDYLMITTQDVRIYLSALYDRKYSRNSISRKISSLRSFYNFLLKQNVIVENPFELIHLKKGSTKLPRFFYEKEMAALFEAVEGDEALQVRNRTLLEVLYGSGLRVSECVNLKIGDIDFDHQVFLVHGKGNKDRYVPFGSYAMEEMQNYLISARQHLIASLTETHDFLFVNARGKPLTVRGIQYILKEIVKKSSLTSDIHPHMLRHTFATHLMNNGADMRTVQELLGHASLSSTQIYTHVTTENLQKSYRNFHPRA